MYMAAGGRRLRARTTTTFWLLTNGAGRSDHVVHACIPALRRYTLDPFCKLGAEDHTTRRVDHVHAHGSGKGEHKLIVNGIAKESHRASAALHRIHSGDRGGPVEVGLAKAVVGKSRSGPVSSQV
jgi:hypothetical protein